MKLRAWLSTCATVAASGSALWAQTTVAPPSSASTAALAAQTALIHPANEKAIFTMRTAGQPDRAVRVLKMNEADAEGMAEVQDVQSGRIFSMPGKVVRAMLSGTKPAMPAAAPVPAPVPVEAPVAAPSVPTTPVANTSPSTPVFQPARIASSIHDRPGTVALTPPREIPTVTAVATIIPNATVPQAPTPRIEPVPESEKARLMAAVQPQTIPPPTVVEVPETTNAVAPPLLVEPQPMPALEPVKTPAPDVIPIAKLVPPQVAAPAPAVPVPAAVAPAPVPVQPTPVPAPAPVPVRPAPAPKAPALPPTPQFGTPLQRPETSSTSMKSVPVQTWQPIRDAATPSNNSLWQPLPAPTETPKPAAPQAEVQAQPVEARTTTVTTQCQFENHTCCPEVATEPQVRSERAAAKCNNVGRLENQVREACQSQIYDLCTSALPSEREEAATKLSESRFAQRPEVKAALLKAAVGDPAPSVRAHCIECLMKIGYNEAGFRIHLQGACENGAKIVQTAARTALANLPRE